MPMTRNTVYAPWYSDEYKIPGSENSDVRDYLSLTPQDIKRELEQNVVNQDEACRKIAILMYQHLQGHRFVGMLAGPTGSGKSFIAENLKAAFPNLVYIRDVSNLTCDGWSGVNKVSTLFKGVRYSYDTAGGPYPLMFLDECDKMFSVKMNAGVENVSESVQYELLTVIHGGEVEIKTITERGPVFSKVDTSKMSFLFAGAFEKKAKDIATKESGASIGFGSSHARLSTYNRELTMDDVREAGCITELCGRIQKLICLNKIGEEDFVNMLNFTDRGPVNELQNEFGITINISKSKKEEIAHNAYVSGLGIRGIKNTIREYIDELMWEDCHAMILEIA